VIEPAVMVELREQLLAWVRELDERENTLLTKEHGMLQAEHALGRARMQCDSPHDRARAIKQDYHARLHSSIVDQWRSQEFDWVLSGH
jgi:hypothetical protein